MQSATNHNEAPKAGFPTNPDHTASIQEWMFSENVAVLREVMPCFI